MACIVEADGFLARSRDRAASRDADAPIGFVRPGYGDLWVTAVLAAGQGSLAVLDDRQNGAEDRLRPQPITAPTLPRAGEAERRFCSLSVCVVERNARVSLRLAP
jgi:hypothetical protein